MRDPKWERATRMVPGLRVFDTEPPDEATEVVPPVSDEEIERMAADIDNQIQDAVHKSQSAARDVRAIFGEGKRKHDAQPWRLERYRSRQGWYTVEESTNRASLAAKQQQIKSDGDANVRIVKGSLK